MMKRIGLIFAMLALVVGGVFAQTNVSGTVLSFDDEEPIVGATVSVVGTNTGTATDINGQFSLTIPKSNSVLRISYIGMKTVEVVASPKMRIVLRSEAENLDEVVVVAYGTAKKSALTGAVSTVSAKDIELRPVSSVTSALEGTTTGLQVNSTLGQPGEDASIRIRGFGSVNGSNAPLYVLDGVPYGGNVSDLNATDIESITVLKDASSAALYGNRASNGVILITTKKGRSDRTKVTVNANIGTYNRGIPEYDKLNAYQWMEAMFQGYRNNLMYGQEWNSANVQAANEKTIAELITNRVKLNIFNKSNETLFDSNGKLAADAQILSGYADDLDWFAPLERNGFRQEYNISGEGANEKSDYFFSAGYLDEKGYVKRSGFNRLTARANMNLQPTKWFKTGVSVAVSHQQTDNSKAISDNVNSIINPFGFSRNIGPIYPVHQHDATTGGYVFDANGKKVYDDGAEYSRPYSVGRHVIWETELDMDRNYRNTVNSQLYGNIYLLKDFTFTVKGDLSLRNVERRTYNNPTIGDGQGNHGRASRYIYRYKNYTAQEQLYWTHEFGNHHVDALAGHENYMWRRNYLYGYKMNETFSGQVDLKNFTELTQLYDYEDNYRTESYLARARYSYDDKYNGEVSWRRDGSSRFYKDNRWGNFWSIGGSWIVSREEFMKPVTWVNNLKLRASYGEVGNDAGVGYYGYMALYTMQTNNEIMALYKSQNEALDIKWETTQSFGIGLEGRYFDRLNLSIEYFDKRSKDLLFDVSLPFSAGGITDSGELAKASVTKNIGTVSNRGWEISADVDVIRNKDWRWNVGTNLTFLKNKIVKLPEENRENGIISGSYKYDEGKSMYTYYVYQFKGVDQMTGNALYRFDSDNYYPAYDASGNKSEAVSGKTAVSSKDGTDYQWINGEVYALNTTYAARDYSGKAIPDLYGSFNTSVSWKSLTLSAMMTFAVGGKAIDWSYQSLMSTSGTGTAIHKDAANSWNGVPEGITATSADRILKDGIPAINFGRSSYNNATSTRFITNGNYLVMKNINLSYQLPRPFVRFIGLSSISLTGSVENLFTCTKRKGMNPQQSFNGGSDNILVTPRVFSFGAKVSF